MANRRTLEAIKRFPLIAATITEDEEYRITLRSLKGAKAEAVAYYASDDEDAIGTAQDMSLRAVREAR
jgi:hypothetical protein